MGPVISRRSMLAGLAGSVGAGSVGAGSLAFGLAGPVWAEGVVRPMRRPDPQAASERFVEVAKLGGVTGFALLDVATGRVIEAFAEDEPVPPASVAKAITTVFALEKLGAARRFSTQVGWPACEGFWHSW